MKKYYHFIGILILIVILIRIDFQKIILYFSGLNLISFALINLLILPTLFLKSYRWRYLLSLQGIDYSVGNSVISYLGGIYAGLITPGRIGESIKAVYIRTDKGIPLIEGMASVTMDRLFDMHLLIFLGAIGFWNFLKFQYERYKIVDASILSLLLFGAIIFLNKSLLEKMSKIIYKAMIYKIDKGLFDSQLKVFLVAVKKVVTGNIYPAFILTLFSQFCYFFQCYLLARLMSLNISFMTVIFFISMATLFSIFPISIWGIGTRDASLIYCFSLIGLNVESAVSYSFLLFISFYLISGILSFIGWVIKGYYGFNIYNKQR